MFKRILIFLFAICILPFMMYAKTKPQYFYNENTGWIVLDTSYAHVTLNSIKGYLWGENIGWICLDTDYGYINVDNEGKCIGYAYGENIGWINFSPVGQGIVCNRVSLKLTGFAWGENIGWLWFGDDIRELEGSFAVYPNPFSPGGSDAARDKTTIEYYLNNDCKVEIYIYAMNGRLVKKIKGSRYNTKGLHQIEWDGRNEKGYIIANGVYMVYIKAGGETVLEKVAVIK